MADNDGQGIIHVHGSKDDLADKNVPAEARSGGSERTHVPPQDSQARACAALAASVFVLLYQ
jgi:hypothetical protein